MPAEDRLISSSMLAEDEASEFSLRPKYLKEYIGQSEVKEHVQIYIEAAKGEVSRLIMPCSTGLPA